MPLKSVFGATKKTGQIGSGATDSVKPTLLSWDQVAKIINGVAFRDWDIQFIFVPQGGLLHVTGHFPNREDDVRDAKEDPERRWMRMKRGTSRYAESEDLYSYMDKNPLATLRETTFFGAQPVAGQNYIPDHARESKEALIRFIYGMILALEDHEIRENFYVFGTRVLDPHGRSLQEIEEASLPYLDKQK